MYSYDIPVFLEAAQIIPATIAEQYSAQGAPEMGYSEYEASDRVELRRGGGLGKTDSAGGCSECRILFVGDPKLVEWAGDQRDANLKGSLVNKLLHSARAPV